MWNCGDENRWCGDEVGMGTVLTGTDGDGVQWLYTYRPPVLWSYLSTFVVNHNVVWLDVAVHNAHAVTVIKRLHSSIMTDTTCPTLITLLAKHYICGQIDAQANLTKEIVHEMRKIHKIWHQSVGKNKAHHIQITAQKWCQMQTCQHLKTKKRNRSQRRPEGPINWNPARSCGGVL